MTDTELEELEIEAAELLAADIKWLMANDQFKRVILQKYINDTSLDVGTSFIGSDDQIQQLKSISDLMAFLTNNIN